MNPPPFDVELQLDRHGAALRHLAGELVRDPHTAADATQEVWLAALARPPRHGAAIGGWLATALRNVVGGWRRQDRRRVRRETEVARVDAVEDHSATVAREEVAQRLLAAVAALESPYREVVWARFFEGKAPREIAAANGESVATVKSRLQRGLRCLRERLGEGGRDDWRGALVMAFGIGKADAAAVAVAGGVLMATWTKVAAAVAVVAAGTWLAWPDVDPSREAAIASSSPPPVLAMTSGVNGDALVVSDPPATLPPQRVVGMVSAPEHVVVVGRCVDEGHVPLAGCEVTLTAAVGQDGIDTSPRSSATGACRARGRSWRCRQVGYAKSATSCFGVAWRFAAACWTARVRR